MSGRVTAGQKVVVLGEGYSVYNEEDMLAQEVSDVWVSEARSVLGALPCLASPACCHTLQD